LKKHRVRASLAGIVVVAALAGSAGAASATLSPPVSGASAIVTIKDGLTTSATTAKPFPVRLTVQKISFPTREGGNVAQPGNVFVHITARVKNLATKARIVPFNGSEFRTMAIGTSHAVPGEEVDSDVCTPPALDGLRDAPAVSDQVTAQWCVTEGSTAMVTAGPKKSKDVTISGEVVSQQDAKPENFALIYSPSDEAQPTILPVGPGGQATTVTT
jgi:hypothetical protein